MLSCWPYMKYEDDLHVARTKWEILGEGWHYRDLVCIFQEVYEETLTGSFFAPGCTACTPLGTGLLTICRVPEGLRSAFYRALDKQAFYWMPHKKYSAKNPNVFLSTRQRHYLQCQKDTLSKENFQSTFWSCKFFQIKKFWTTKVE